jgi:hypothetical protein
MKRILYALTVIALTILVGCNATESTATIEPGVYYTRLRKPLQRNRLLPQPPQRPRLYQRLLRQQPPRQAPLLYPPRSQGHRQRPIHATGRCSFTM